MTFHCAFISPDFIAEALSLPFPLLQSLIASIGTSLLRTHEFYAYAVTPYELIQQQQQQATATVASNTDGKLPTIPVDSLSDVDVLRQFVKR